MPLMWAGWGRVSVAEDPVQQGMAAKKCRTTLGMLGTSERA